MIEVPFQGRFAFTITTFSSKEFEQNPSPAKRAAKDGPVFIADHGFYAYVLLTMEEYRKITGKRESILDLLAMPEIAEIDPDFEFPRMGDEFPRPADWS
jgi:PHD/YefM family antitoxin component YafN of YafNO toxin-antitoxin module